MRLRLIKSPCPQSVIKAVALPVLDGYSQERLNMIMRMHTSTRTRRKAMLCFAAPCHKAMCTSVHTRSGRCGSIA